MSSNKKGGRSQRASGGGGGDAAVAAAVISEPLGRDELSSFDPMEVITCLSDSLIQPVPLKDVVAAGKKFRIVGHYLEKYNEFDIMSLDVKNDDEFRLNEDLMEVVESSDEMLDRIPETKQVVLAPVNKKLFKRAIVLKRVERHTVLVHFIDAGGRSVLEIDKLRPVTKGLMKYPILTYHVVMDGLPDTNFLFSRDDFAGLMSKLSRVDMSVKLSEDVKKKGIFSSSNKVILSYEKEGVKTILCDEIINLKKWEWELTSDLLGSDDDICERGAFGTKSRSSEDNIIIHFSLKVGAKFTATVSRIVADESNSKDAVLHLVLLDDPAHQNYFDVLHRQLNRYAGYIAKSPFFPAINERLMFKLKTNAGTKSKYEKLVKVTDKWCRAVRLDDNSVYLFDVDDTVPFTALPQPDYEIRRIYGEFFKIPILTVKVHVKRQGKALSVGSAKEIFRPLQRFGFEILKVLDKGEYEADFVALKESRRGNK